MRTACLRSFALTILAGTALAACTTRNPYGDSMWYFRPEPESNITPRVQAGPYMLAMFEGGTGRPLSWTDLWEGMRWADIVVVGEQHDDLNGHLVQTTLVEQAMAAWPGSVLSMEMLERNEQAAVDAYVAGTLSKDNFVEQTGSSDWAGKGSWDKFYQPMIDATREGHGRVVAANAPRKYVRQARTDGYESLAALPPEERALFDLPESDPPSSYRERFREFMAGDGDPPNDEKLDTMLRSQRLWDATMAASIATAYRALPRHAKVIHVVGQFHSEYDGGLISEIATRVGGGRILTVSIQKGEATGLRDADRGKADVVVYGVAPPPTWNALMSRRKPIPNPDAQTPEELPEWGVAF